MKNKQTNKLKVVVCGIILFSLMLLASDLYDKHYCKVNGPDYYHACK